jgi:release factor glutamine methyltransferase
VAYLVGQREFFSLTFEVTPDVLIPRPETELVVVRALDVAKQMPLTERADGIKIADVGVGSGILAVTLAKRLPAARVTGIDVSGKALEVARRNATRHAVADRIEWVESDVFAGVPAEREFDIIVSNPPYITTAEMNGLAEDVRRFEPTVALVGGKTGTEVIERLIPQAAERLRPEGWLIIEISPTIVGRVEALLEADARLKRRPTVKDLAGLPRVVQAQRRNS